MAREDGSRLSAAARAQMIENLRVSLAKINSLASKPMVKATFKELQVACGVAAAQAEALSVVG
jgi:hypothetical protein